MLVSCDIQCQKPKQRTKTIFDYKNADIEGLKNYIIGFDFNTTVFSHPIELQAELYSDILTNAFSLFVPFKTFQVREDDQPWASSYTRLLLRKKNRNYRFYKKYNSQYNFLLNQENTNPEILTKYLNKKK